MSFSRASFMIENPYTVIVTPFELEFCADGRHELHTSAEESASAIVRMNLFIIVFILLRLDPPTRPDNIQISGSGKAVILPHVIKIDGNVFRQSAINTDRKSISREALEQ